MPALPEISALDLSALLCSRVCHDIISPVGAVANGLELLDEDVDEETREIAMGLIRSSTANASARLQFARIAFGAAGPHLDVRQLFVQVVGQREHGEMLAGKMPRQH